MWGDNAVGNKRRIVSVLESLPRILFAGASHLTNHLRASFGVILRPTSYSI